MKTVKRSLLVNLVVVLTLLISAANVRASAVPATVSTANVTQQKQQAINWNDWDVIPGRVLIKYRSAKSNDLKQGIAGAGVAGLRLTPIEAQVRQAVGASIGAAAPPEP